MADWQDDSGTRRPLGGLIYFVSAVLVVGAISWVIWLVMACK